MQPLSLVPNPAQLVRLNLNAMRGSSLALFALSIFLLDLALGNEVFLSCLAGTPAIGPGAPNFSNLAKKGYRNDVATPAAIVQATNYDHVGDAIRCANVANLKVCARSGGHSLVGKSTCSGVLIDVSAMNTVTVNGEGIATIGAGANIGQTLWKLWETRRWFAAGVCPGVGIAGYMLGGGHGPYEGKLGLACDALVEVTLIDRFGKMKVASSQVNTELFWSMCGAGGGQFGIVTEFKIKTAPSFKYDNSVVFKIAWPRSSAGEVISKWTNYDEKGGDVWFRLEMKKLSKVLDGYGSCYDVGSTEACLKRLESAPFYNAPGVKVVYMSKVDNALDLHAFFGPGGGWGSFRAGNVQNAMLGRAFAESGNANTRTFQSTFMKKDARPGPEFWQKWADLCGEPGLPSIPWSVCEMNLWGNAIDGGADNAFAHRSANVITHYIIGGGSPEHRATAYNRMKAHFAPTTSGVYANYPELELKNYAQLYWGSSLKRLSALKKEYDPELFFANPQPIPLP